MLPFIIIITSRYKTIRIEKQKNSLVEFPNRTANLDGRSPLKYRRLAADVEADLLIRIVLHVARVLAQDDRLGARAQLLARSTVAFLLGAGLGRGAVALRPRLLPVLGHHLLALHLPLFHASPAGCRALRGKCETLSLLYNHVFVV